MTTPLTINTASLQLVDCAGLAVFTQVDMDKKHASGRRKQDNSQTTPDPDAIDSWVWELLAGRMISTIAMEADDFGSFISFWSYFSILYCLEIPFSLFFLSLEFMYRNYTYVILVFFCVSII